MSDNLRETGQDGVSALTFDILTP